MAGAFSFGYNKGYKPKQTLPYDHSLHAGKYQIPCLSCHVQADKNRHATVPSLNICMNCHNGVAINKPAVQTLRKAYDKGYSIPWLKVHLLPDFVMFNHQAHVKADIRCQTCHGNIETMKEVEQSSVLSMGWCLNCHRNPEDAREFAKQKKPDGSINQAPVSCGTCHY